MHKSKTPRTYYSKGKESRQSLLMGFSGRGAQYKNDEFENLLKEHARRTYCFGAGLISVRASNRTMGLYRTALDVGMLEEMRILNKEW